IAGETAFAFDTGKRPGGNPAARLPAQLLHAGIGCARRGRPATDRWRCIGVIRRGTSATPEDPVEKIVVGVGPVPVVIAVRPERVVEHVGIGIRPEYRTVPGDECGAMSLPPGAVSRQMPESIARYATCLLRKSRSEPTLPCDIGSHAGDAIASVCAQRLRVGPRLCCAGLNHLLSAQGALLARVANFLAALSPLRSGQTAQFAIFGATQIALGAQLLPRREPRL